MAIQTTEMDVVVTAHLLKIVGYVEVGHQHQKTADTTAHLATIKIAQPILSTESIPVEMDLKYLKRHVMMGILIMLMAAAPTEHQLIVIMCEKEEVRHQEIYEHNVQMAITKITPRILNSESQDVEMGTE